MSLKPLLSATTNIYPTENFVKKVSDLMTGIIDRNQWVLSVEEMQLSTHEITSPEGLLPLIMWIAGEKMKDLGFGQQELGFRVNSEALCGVAPDLDAPIAPISIWAFVIAEELERVATSPDISAEINTWFNRWNAALAEKSLRLFPPKAAAPTSQTAVGSGS